MRHIVLRAKVPVDPSGVEFSRAPAAILLNIRNSAVKQTIQNTQMKLTQSKRITRPRRRRLPKWTKPRDVSTIQTNQLSASQNARIVRSGLGGHGDDPGGLGCGPQQARPRQSSQKQINPNQRSLKPKSPTTRYGGVYLNNGDSGNIRMENKPRFEHHLNRKSSWSLESFTHNRQCKEDRSRIVEYLDISILFSHTISFEFLFYLWTWSILRLVITSQSKQCFQL